MVLYPKDLFESAGLSAADWDFAFVLVLHDHSIRTIKVRDKLPHFFYIDQIAAVGSEKSFWIESGFQIPQRITSQVEVSFCFDVNIVLICGNIYNFFRPNQDGFPVIFSSNHFQGFEFRDILLDRFSFRLTWSRRFTLSYRI